MTVSKTTNSGSTWTRYHLSTSPGYTLALVIDPTNSNIVYTGGYPDLYKTTDGGNTWFTSTTGITDTILDIAIDTNDTSILYAATPDGIFKTTNSGSNWTNMGCSGARAVLIDPGSNNIIYAGTNSGVYKSITGGGSWTAMNDGLDDLSVTSLGINSDIYLFAGTKNAGMFRWDLNVGIQEETMDGKCLLSAIPNPTRGRISLHYQLTKTTMVNLSIYDIQGRLVKTIVDEPQNSGKYTIIWSGLDDEDNSVATGIYFYRFSTDKTIQIQKLILIR